MKTKLLGLIACIALLGSTWQASAATLDWSFNFTLLADQTDGSEFTGSGIFVTQDTPAGGPYLIISINNGLLNGTTPISLIAPDTIHTPPEPVFNDNLLFTSGEPLDGEGVGFETPDGVIWSIWFSPYTDVFEWCNNSVTGGGYSCDSPPDPGIDVISFSVSEYTPLPAALPLFASGLGVMGLIVRRRKRKNVAAIAAA